MTQVFKRSTWACGVLRDACRAVGNPTIVVQNALAHAFWPVDYFCAFLLGGRSLYMNKGKLFRFRFFPRGLYESWIKEENTLHMHDTNNYTREHFFNGGINRFCLWFGHFPFSAISYFLVIISTLEAFFSIRIREALRFIHERITSVTMFWSHYS